eukprot:CAMPEP_0174872656 /NCGR_PEP_ID=MMETSP1114-20130205/73612_1 /TAXON_ID=312471 /ORGANISM="Neobodo designis, Strain CCAP 1951/1" /LENGTH=71 /DNA_ID=CAMNT_0016107965 /DNA_START=35 /DNA_END=253 /DNA_ORIENTATION=-
MSTVRRLSNTASSPAVGRTLTSPHQQCDMRAAAAMGVPGGIEGRQPPRTRATHTSGVPGSSSHGAAPPDHT